MTGAVNALLAASHICTDCALFSGSYALTQQGYGRMIAYGNGIFMVVSKRFNAPTSEIAVDTSVDLLTWTARPNLVLASSVLAGTINSIQQFAFGGGQFVFVSQLDSTTIYSSVDGSSWVTHTRPATPNPGDVALSYANGRWFIFSQTTASVNFFSSTDLDTWTTHAFTGHTSETIKGFVYANSLYWTDFISGKDKLGSSSNLTVWAERATNHPDYPGRQTHFLFPAGDVGIIQMTGNFSNGMAINYLDIAANSLTVRYSPGASTASFPRWIGCMKAQGSYLAWTQGGGSNVTQRFYCSQDGISWHAVTALVEHQIFGMASNGRGLYAALSGTISAYPDTIVTNRVYIGRC